MKNKKICGKKAEVKAIEYVDCIRVWLKDVNIEDARVKKDYMDFYGIGGAELVKDILKEGFKYFEDREKGILRFVPCHQILSIYFYQNQKVFDEVTGLPQIFKIGQRDVIC